MNMKNIKKIILTAVFFALIVLSACGAKMPDAAVGTWRYFRAGRLTNEMTIKQDGPTSGYYKMEIFKDGYSEVHEGSWVYQRKDGLFRLENQFGFTTLNRIKVSGDVLYISNTDDPDNVIELKRAWEEE